MYLAYSSFCHSLPHKHLTILLKLRLKQGFSSSWASMLC